MKKPILLFIGLCLAATITAQEKPAGNGWWNNNPSLVMPIREVGVTGIRPMKEIGVQKTQTGHERQVHRPDRTDVRFPAG